MKSTFVALLFDLAAKMPLRMLHALGSLLGWIVYRMTSKYSARMRENLANAWRGKTETEYRQILYANIKEMGKSICELPWVWRQPLEKVLLNVRSVHGAEYVEAARRSGQGTIFLTPHLGCFEAVGLYLAGNMAITCMYRVPRLAWLDPVIRRGRERGGMKLARADMTGVRVLLKALKQGEAIGLLPDQVPSRGEGEWADFFGRPAYTMTLAGRLAEASGANVLLSYGKRLPHGAGYELHFKPMELNPEASFAAQLNPALEKLICTCPEQYLWSYNRYKVPRGVPKPGQAGGH